LKVLDFGIARIMESSTGGRSTVDGTLLGTPAFSPPEQARGRVGEMDERSDVWAVGATLFTLLTGHLVHAADTTNEQLGLAMSAAAPSLSSIDPSLPPAVVALVDRALAYDQRDRWPSALAMQSAVQSVRGALATEGGRVPVGWSLGTEDPARGVETFDPQRGSKRVGRRQALLAAAALVAVGALGSIAASHRSTDARNMEPPSVGPAPSSPSPIVSLAPVEAASTAVTESLRRPQSADPVLVPPKNEEPRFTRVESRRAAPLKRVSVPIVPSASVAPPVSPSSTLSSMSPPEPPRNPFDRRH
jgi:serine/threonine-protein kinase